MVKTITEFIKSANIKSPREMAWIGRSFFKGIGTSKDYEQAIKWFKKAANLGDAEAQLHLGIMYENGNGVDQNYSEALYWYDLAKSSGAKEALDYRKRCELKLTESKKRGKSTQARANFRVKLQSDYLATITDMELGKLSDDLSKDEIDKEIVDFVKEWVFNVSQDSFEIDDEQADAIATTNGHVQVVARAGSGKTSTLVYRTLFLLKHCRIEPEQILILAFNKKAVEDIYDKLCNLHEMDTINTSPTCLPHISTFHSFAHSIVRPREKLIYDEEQRPELSRVIRDLVYGLLNNPQLRAKIQSIMFDFFKGDWEQIIRSGYGKHKREFIEFLRARGNFETLGGQYVKSDGEKAIANFLFEYDIQYSYEQTHLWDGEPYRPDFTLNELNVVIEYFGLNGTYKYDEDAVKKIEYWYKRPEYLFIDLYPFQMKNGEFKSVIKNRLKQKKSAWVRLSEDEIWVKVKDRAIGRFIKTTSQFINRCRQRFWSADRLIMEIEGHSYLTDDSCDVEKRFYELMVITYKKYLDTLIQREKEDFNGLVQRAVRLIEGGKVDFKSRKSGNGDITKLRYVFIDEFQDFSELFFKLLNSIQKKNGGVGVFCVGDDWQAINRFAGSDIRFFRDFCQHIGKYKGITLSRNYRSLTGIVNAGNMLMEGNGIKAVPSRKESGSVELADLKHLSSYHARIGRVDYNRDVLKSALVYLLNQAINDESRIVVLTRTGKINGMDIEKYEKDILEEFPTGSNDVISFSTTHSYKGLENDIVIVLADEYPLIHPNWIFSRLFGDTLDSAVEDERRLFYVAITRAIKKLVFVIDDLSETQFLSEIASSISKHIEWRTYSLPSNNNDHVVKITGTTYTTKDQLKLRDEGYTYTKFDRTNTFWSKTVLYTNDPVTDVLNEKWVNVAKKLTGSRVLQRVTIQFIHNSDKVTDECHIEHGQIIRRIP